MAKTLLVFSLAIAALVLGPIAYRHLFGPPPPVIAGDLSQTPNHGIELSAVSKQVEAAQAVNKDLRLRLKAVDAAGRRLERAQFPTVNRGLAALLRDPNQRDVAVQSIKAQQHTQYRLLYSLLGLSSDQQAALETMLAETTAKKDDAAAELDDDAPVADYKAYAAQLNRELQQSATSLAGPENAKLIMEVVSDSSGLWDRVSTIDLQLRHAHAAPLRSDQAIALKLALANETQTDPKSSDLAALGSWAQLKRESNQRVVASLRGTLTETQLAALSRQLDNDVAIETMSLYQPAPPLADQHR